MKKSSTLGILFVIVGVIGLLYVFSSGGKSPLSGIGSFFQKEINHEQIIDVQQLERIKIDSRSVNVQIVKSEQETARILMHGQATRNNYNFDVMQTGDTLHVSTGEKTGFRLGFNISNVKMTVELPEKHWNQVSVKASSGKIILDSIYSDRLELKANSGNMDISHVRTDHLTAETNSGKINLNQIDGNDLKVKSSSGGIELESITAQLITFNASSGSIRLVDSDAQLKGRTSSGSIRISQKDLLHDADLESSSGSISISLDQAPQSMAVDFRGSSGSGRIELDGFIYEDQSRDRNRIMGAFGEGDVKLKARTSSGNFTLK